MNDLALPGAVLLIAFATFALVRGVATALDGGHSASRVRLQSFAPAEDAPHTGRRSRRGRRGAPSNTDTGRWLRRAGLSWEPRDFVVLTVTAGLATAALMIALTGSVVAGCAAGGLGAAVPAVLVQRKSRTRAAALNSQVVETLEIITSSLRSGFGFVQSLELAAREQREPIAGELMQTIREINLGASTDEALSRLVERTGDEDLQLAIDAVVIQRRIGGDLSEVLANISTMIRERIRIRGEIQTMTAQARMSSWIVGLLPLVLAGVMTLLQPEQMRVLIDTPVGRLMVFGALVMQIIGFMMVRRIAAIAY
jgi:tight adherence protein B